LEFELRIVGGGELREQLLALADSQGLGGVVKLTGSVSQARVVEELAAAELFALTPAVMPDGDRDGIPNVLLEAMAAGVPVVAAAMSGIPELLTDRVNARLVEPNRPDLLAAVLAELLADAPQRERLGAAGQRFVSEQCAWPQVIAPLRELLSEALLAESPQPDVQLEPAAAPAS
jgi:glycosyltransferase involved in cell wall biosynthesis